MFTPACENIKDQTTWGVGILRLEMQLLVPLGPDTRSSHPRLHRQHASWQPEAQFHRDRDLRWEVLDPLQAPAATAVNVAIPS